MRRITHINNKDANYILIASRTLRISEIIGEINPQLMGERSTLSNALNNILRYVLVNEPISNDIDIEKSRDRARFNRVGIEIAILNDMLLNLNNSTTTREQDIKALINPLISLVNEELERYNNTQEEPKTKGGTSVKDLQHNQEAKDREPKETHNKSQ